MAVADRALPTAHFTGVPQAIYEKNTSKKGPDTARTDQNTPSGRLKRRNAFLY